MLELVHSLGLDCRFSVIHRCQTVEIPFQCPLDRQIIFVFILIPYGNVLSFLSSFLDVYVRSPPPLQISLSFSFFLFLIFMRLKEREDKG